jgi:hypothetical protein
VWLARVTRRQRRRGTCVCAALVVVGAWALSVLGRHRPSARSLKLRRPAAAAAEAAASRRLRRAAQAERRWHFGAAMPWCGYNSAVTASHRARDGARTLRMSVKPPVPSPLPSPRSPSSSSSPRPLSPAPPLAPPHPPFGPRSVSRCLGLSPLLCPAASSLSFLFRPRLPGLLLLLLLLLGDGGRRNGRATRGPTAGRWGTKDAAEQKSLSRRPRASGRAAIAQHAVGDPL